MKLQISGAQQIPAEQLRRLRATAERAVSFFEEHFGSVQTPLKINLDPQTLSTGYNREEDTVNFPEAAHLINRGLESEDVIDHELFHALVARHYPHTSTPESLQGPEGASLHEGLADFFAYKLQPDPYFGERYRSDKPHLRQYSNQLSVSLSPGSHAKGNAITAHLLRAGVELEQIRDFLQKGNFSLEALQAVSPRLSEDLGRDSTFSVQQRVSNYPDSAIKRYRISPERPMQVEFNPNSALLQAHPDFRVEWTTMEGLPSKEYLIQTEDQLHFQVAATPQSRAEKLLAIYYDGQNQIGSQPYYLSVLKDREVQGLEIHPVNPVQEVA
ncbi:hypothetical protein JST97_02420 [bacterium]|nr:hypothetical protein [bacterium]